MSKTRRKYKKKGGKAIASGGFGCVFKPALKCQGQGSRENNKISKLMTEKHALEEYEEISNVKNKLDGIDDYEDYFLLYDVTICKPDKLIKSDLHNFNDKCSALPKDDITKNNINTKLDEVMSLNLPNGGLPVDDYIFKNGTFKKIYNVHVQLVDLLKNGIIQMNKHNIYHSDIKDSNVLVDDKDKKLKTRLIDWGLAVEYSPSKNTQFPKNWRNRPLQFNVPFSVIIFTDSFYDKYSEYLKENDDVNDESLRLFVMEYINFWLKERGQGHYKFINEIIFKLFSHSLKDIPEKDKPMYIETEITIPLIVDYLVDVLLHYTKFKNDGSLNLREYLNDVYINIVDIYGFINIYYPLLELLSDSYNSLSSNKIKLFNQLAFIYYNYLYAPRHNPININELLKNLNVLGDLIKYVADEEDKNLLSTSTTRETKTKKRSKNYSTFKRKPFVKRFKNPILLS
jgi:serine/threonine protein kinase